MSEQTVDQLAEANAVVENYREGAAYALERLKLCHESSVREITDNLMALFDTLIGMDGKAHLKALRDHETQVMALLAYRANAVDALLPDTCPGCGMTERQHAERCRFGLALTLLPNGMPSIEDGSTFKLGVVADQIRRWAGEIDSSFHAESHPRLRSVTDDMRRIASKM